jgi:hypothetical protein
MMILEIVLVAPAVLVAILLAGSLARPDLVAATVAPVLGRRADS